MLRPGELFILRNVANLVPPYEPEGKYHGTSAGIEFAVQVLKVPHLIVLGHSRCGGVAAYRQKVRDKVPERGFIGSWLTMLDNLKIDESEIFEFGDETAFEFAAIRSSLANLRTFPFVKKREKEGLLTLHGLHFDLASGSRAGARRGERQFHRIWMQPRRGSPRGTWRWQARRARSAPRASAAHVLHELAAFRSGLLRAAWPSAACWSA